MSALRFTKDHEWVQDKGDGTVAIGITDYARQALGDLVFLELPKTGKTLKKGAHFAVIESVKAASEIYTPLDGEVVAVNESLADDLESLGSDPAKGWIITLKPDNADTSTLMDEAGYAAFVKGL